MKNSLTISLLGGDKRQEYIADILCENGFTVRKFGLTGATDNCVNAEAAIQGADYLFLPVPVTRDGYRLNCDKEIFISDIIKKIPASCKVFGGKLPPSLKDFLNSEKIGYNDYFDDPWYIWENAYISSEGAIHVLMQELDTVIEEANILICGYGRIGKCLSKALKSFGASVTVAARRAEPISEAHYFGKLKTDIIDYRREGIFDTEKKYDVIINTVPGWIFDSSNKAMLKNAIYIELASPPYGGEGEFLKTNAKKYILSSGIPGKYAPKSAARAIFNSFIRTNGRGEI